MPVLPTSPDDFASTLADLVRRVSILERNGLRVQGANYDAAGTTTSTTYANLAGSPPNTPAVVNVDVTTSNLLVVISCAMVTPPNGAGFVSVVLNPLDGGPVLGPDDAFALTAGVAAEGIAFYGSLAIPFQQIPNGPYDVVAYYKVGAGNGSNPTTFAGRALTTISGW